MAIQYQMIADTEAQLSVLELSQGLSQGYTTVKSLFKNICLKICFREDMSGFSPLESQFSFCFHWSPSSSNFWLCLLETQVCAEVHKIPKYLDWNTNLHCRLHFFPLSLNCPVPVLKLQFIVCFNLCKQIRLSKPHLETLETDQYSEILRLKLHYVAKAGRANQARGHQMVPRVVETENVFGFTTDAFAH